jgi:hypothetical protein
VIAAGRCASHRLTRVSGSVFSTAIVGASGENVAGV